MAGKVQYTLSYRYQALYWAVELVLKSVLSHLSRRAKAWGLAELSAYLVMALLVAGSFGDFREAIAAQAAGLVAAELRAYLVLSKGRKGRESQEPDGGPESQDAGDSEADSEPD